MDSADDLSKAFRAFQENVQFVIDRKQTSQQEVRLLKTQILAERKETARLQHLVAKLEEDTPESVRELEDELHEANAELASTERERIYWESVCETYHHALRLRAKFNDNTDPTKVSFAFFTKPVGGQHVPARSVVIDDMTPSKVDFNWDQLDSLLKEEDAKNKRKFPFTPQDHKKADAAVASDKAQASRSGSEVAPFTTVDQ